VVRVHPAVPVKYLKLLHNCGAILWRSLFRLFGEAPGKHDSDFSCVGLRAWLAPDCECSWTARAPFCKFVHRRPTDHLQADNG
jgi:hypothetical protein